MGPVIVISVLVLALLATIVMLTRELSGTRAAVAGLIQAQQCSDQQLVKAINAKQAELDRLREELRTLLLGMKLDVFSPSYWQGAIDGICADGQKIREAIELLRGVADRGVNRYPKLRGLADNYEQMVTSVQNLVDNPKS